jgi:hypothetical protein
MDIYEVVSHIFWSDAVKIIKLTIRPIGRHQSRSSPLPHVDTGPTVSSIFGTLLGTPFLSQCQALCDSTWISSVVSHRRPLSFNLIFGDKMSLGAKSPVMTLTRRFHRRRRADEVQCRRRSAATSLQVSYTTPNRHVWKLLTSTQLRATWHTDSLDMVVLQSTGASR